MNQSVFDTVPIKNSIDIFEGSMPRYEKITQILDLDKDQMSKATGIAKNKMRFDDRMYLQHGEVVLNVSKARKFGLLVGQLTAAYERLS